MAGPDRNSDGGAGSLWGCGPALACSAVRQVLFALVVLHVVLGYREQKKIADNLAKLELDDAPCPGRDPPPGGNAQEPCRKRR